MVSEEFAPNRVEFVLNCVDAAPSGGRNGEFVAIRGTGPPRVRRPVLALRGDDRHHRPVAFLVERWPLASIRRCVSASTIARIALNSGCASV